MIEVCGLSADVPDHVRLAESAAAKLSSYDPERIYRRFGLTDTPNGEWYWYRDDWRGRQGDMPTPAQVVETIAKKRVTTANPRASPEDDTMERLQARLRARQGR